jgi:F0F1-type ATP synthase assembly protein I
LNPKNKRRQELEALVPRHYNAAAILTGAGAHVQDEGSALSRTGITPALDAMSDVLARGKLLVVRIALLQTACAVLVAGVFGVWGGRTASLSALAGGLIVAMGSLLMGWRSFAPGIASAAALTRAMYGGVALKWLWFGLAVYVALARLKLPAAPLVSGLAAAQLGYWLGLIRLK